MISKQIQKEYADNRNSAKPSKLAVGDYVLLKQKQQNKFTSPFDPVPFLVTRRNGNSVTIERPGCVRQRNISQLKIIPKPQTETVQTKPKAQPCSSETSKMLPSNFVVIPMPQSPSVDRENDNIPTPTSSDTDNRPQFTNTGLLVPTHPVIEVTRLPVHDPKVWDRCLNPSLRNLRERRTCRRFNPHDTISHYR